MGPWSFPIVAEARMAERLLEVEGARLALADATGAGSRGSARAGDPQAQTRGHRCHARRLPGARWAGDGRRRSRRRLGVPVRPTFRIVMTPALVSGEWVCRPMATPRRGWMTRG